MIISTLSISLSENIYMDDYNYLFDSLSKDYTFLDKSELENVKEYNIKYLESSVNNPETFIKLLDSVFYSLYNKNYLGVLSKNSYDYLSQNPKYDALITDKVKETYEPLPSYEIKLQDLDIKYIEDKKTLYISPTQMISGEKDKTLLYDSISKYKDVENLVIDLRNCKGANDDYWMNNFVAPLGKTYKLQKYVYLKNPQVGKIYGDYKIQALSECSCTVRKQATENKR